MTLLGYRYRKFVYGIFATERISLKCKSGSKRCETEQALHVFDGTSYMFAMVDTRTPEQRRRIMQSVKTKNTGPEQAVRKALFAAGYRFRLHRRDLPGSPDIVFPGREKVIFVHGCFWHGHDCPKGRASKSRKEYWGPKIEANKARDTRNIADLESLGWKGHIVWQCELKDADALMTRLSDFLNESKISIDNIRTNQ